LVALLHQRTWVAISLQVIAILVHENALLIGFPAFCFGWFLMARRKQPDDRRGLPVWPLATPLAAFILLALSQRMASPDVEQALTAHLSTYPFIARSIGSVRVPHWITISFSESYRLHQGLFLGRVLSQSMLGLVLPSTLAILAATFDAYRIRAVSAASILV